MCAVQINLPCLASGLGGGEVKIMNTRCCFLQTIYKSQQMCMFQTLPSGDDVKKMSDFKFKFRISWGRSSFHPSINHSSIFQQLSGSGFAEAADVRLVLLPQHVLLFRLMGPLGKIKYGNAKRQLKFWSCLNCVLNVSLKYNLSRESRSLS